MRRVNPFDSESGASYQLTQNLRAVYPPSFSVPCADVCKGELRPLPVYKTWAMVLEAAPGCVVVLVFDVMWAMQVVLTARRVIKWAGVPVAWSTK